MHFLLPNVFLKLYSFLYHPSCIEGDISYNEYKNRPQQWNPFPKRVIFSDILDGQVETNWYVGRLVVFFHFQFIPSGTQSSYALIEPMAINSVTSFDSTYQSNNKKYVVINVGQIDGCVGLLTDIDCTEQEKQSRRIIEQGAERSFKYVSRPGRVFPKKTWAPSALIKQSALLLLCFYFGWCK